MEMMVIQLVTEIFGFATYNFIIIVMGKFHPPAFIEPFSLFFGGNVLSWSYLLLQL